MGIGYARRIKEKARTMDYIIHQKVYEGKEEKEKRENIGAEIINTGYAVTTNPECSRKRVKLRMYISAVLRC